MANHSESSHDPGTPSVDEAIRWLMDSMEAAGVVGFSDDYIAPEDFFQQRWKSTPSDEGPLGAPGNALTLEQILNESDAEGTLRDKRVQILNADKALRQQVKVEVHRRLLASGMSEKEIGEIVGKKATLTTMTKLLYERQKPKLRVIKTVSCLIVTGLPGTMRLSSIRLPRNASLRFIYDELRQFVSTRLLCVTPKGMPREQLDNIMSAWRYQTVTVNDKGKVAPKDNKRVLLKHDLDYRDMVKKVITSDPQTLFPLLTPLNPVTSKPNFQTESAEAAEKKSDEMSTQTSDGPRSGSEEDEEEEDDDANNAWDEWIQADGFKPVDWKEVAKRISQGEDVMAYSFPEDWGI